MYIAAKSMLNLYFVLIDLFSIELAFFTAYFIRHNTFRMPQLYIEMALIFALIDIVVVYFKNSYKQVLKRGYYIEFKQTAIHVLLVVILGTAFLFLIKRGQEYSRITFLLMGCIGILISYIARCILKKYLRGAKYAYNKSSMIVVGHTLRECKEIIEDLSSSYNDFLITGVCILDKNEKALEVLKVPVVAGREDILEYICKNWVDEVFLSIDIKDGLIEEMEKLGVTLHIKLAKESNMTKQVVEDIANYRVLSSSINIVSAKEILLKRLMDIIGSIFGIMLTGILFTIIGPIIYIKSPGPILFSQERVGKNGKVFKIYKFRSMYLDAEEKKQALMKNNKIKDGFMFKMEDDPRIIGGRCGIGGFLRKTSLDEFPQFFNVLKGDMSLVGTRPPTVDEWLKYKLDHRKRLAIKPGITGMWQVSGRSDILDFEKVVELDTEYIRNWNLGLDIKILLKTVLVVFKRKGSA